MSKYLSMSKALTASVVIGAALSASYNNVFKTAKQKQYELGKAFADTNKKLKASDAVVEYKHKLTALKRKYAEAGGGNRRMAAGIADLEKRYRAAKRELKSYGFAVGDAVKAQKRLAKESKKLSRALESGAILERNKALRQELHTRALPVLGAAYGVGRALGGAMAVEQQERSIPAHAGKPNWRWARSACMWVYPRACGETAETRPRNIALMGLSPRMRGNRCFGAGAARLHGSIPAHAGKPALLALGKAQSRVYPRACGETILTEP